MSTTSNHENGKPDTINVRVFRQDGPGKSGYWEMHQVDYEPEMNVISALQKIAAKAETAGGKKVAPVVWDCNCLEEICGACTMIINGRVRQACSALIDRLLDERSDCVELRPMSKFPVIRDLMVDRSRLFRALKKVLAWVPVDGYFDLGPGPLVSREHQEQSYPLSQCMSCGCCLEACPQYTKTELTRGANETEEDFASRQDAEFDRRFLGAHAISQVMLFNMNPTGKHSASERLDALKAEGGIQICGNAQNCVAVCPKGIPLTTSIARAGRATTVHSLKQLFDA